MCPEWEMSNGDRTNVETFTTEGDVYITQPEDGDSAIAVLSASMHTPEEKYEITQKRDRLIQLENGLRVTVKENSQGKVIYNGSTQKQCPLVVKHPNFFYLRFTDKKPVA